MKSRSKAIAVPGPMKWITGVSLTLAYACGFAQPVVAQTQPPASIPGASAWQAGHTIVNPPVRFDHSLPLPQMVAAYQIPPRPDRQHSTTAPVTQPTVAPPVATITPQGAAVEQVTQG